MATYVKVSGATIPAAISGAMKDALWGGRASKSITMRRAYTTVAGYFVDNVTWSIIDDVIDEEGQTSQVEYDNSEYSLRGDITVHRDGTTTVKMGKPTEAETAEGEIDNLVPYLNDAGLTEIRDRFPLWAAGSEYAAGDVAREGENVFRCLQAHTSQAGWNPLATPSLWGICHTKNPQKAVAWVTPAGTSGLYFKDECYKDGETVYRQVYDGGNAYDAVAMPAYWEQV